MNELQAKLARRRSLNGESVEWNPAKTSSTTIGTGKWESIESVPSQDFRRTISQRDSTSAIATGSTSATEELQRKLARRRNLNGEVIREESTNETLEDQNVSQRSRSISNGSQTMKFQDFDGFQESSLPQRAVSQESSEFRIDLRTVSDVSDGSDSGDAIEQSESNMVPPLNGELNSSGISSDEVIPSRAVEDEQTSSHLSETTSLVPAGIPEEAIERVNVILESNKFDHTSVGTLSEMPSDNLNTVDSIEETYPKHDPIEETDSKHDPIEETCPKPEPIEETYPKHDPIEETDSKHDTIEETDSKHDPIEETCPKPEPIEETYPKHDPIEETDSKQDPIEETDPKLDSKEEADLGPVTVAVDNPVKAQSPAVTSDRKKGAPASIATSSTSATDELSKKLARRRNLNGEIPGAVESIPVIPVIQSPSKDSSQTQIRQSSSPVRRSAAPPVSVPVIAAPPPIPAKSFLAKDDDDEENEDFDLPFNRSSKSQSEKKSAKKGIWDDDTVLATLEEEDPLNFTLPVNKEEVTKKLFKPKDPPPPIPIIAPAPIIEEEKIQEKQSVLAETVDPEEKKEEDEEEEGELEIDESLPKLPQRFLDAQKAQKESNNADKKSKFNWYPGKYIKERRLPWSSPNSQKASSGRGNKIGSLIDQQQAFNDFVHGLAERSHSVGIREGDDLGIGLTFDEEEIVDATGKSFLEELEEANNRSEGLFSPGGSITPPPPSSASLSQSVKRRSSNLSSNTADSFLQEFLQENDRLLRELTEEIVSAPVIKDQKETSEPTKEVEGEEDDRDVAPALPPPPLPTSLLTRGNSVGARNRSSASGGGGNLFDDDVVTPPPLSGSVAVANRASLFGEEETPATATTVPPTLSSSSASLSPPPPEKVSEISSLDLLLGGGSSRQQYNPLEVGSQQSLVRSFLNASARRSSALQEPTIRSSVDIRARGLLGDDLEEEEEEEDDEEAEDQTQSNSNNGGNSNSNNNHAGKRVDLFGDKRTKKKKNKNKTEETKKVHSTNNDQNSVEEQIAYEDFLLRLKRCPELFEITNRFISSIKGPNGDGSPPSKLQRIDYRFYGIESVDERCRLFFEEVHHKLLKRKIFSRFSAAAAAEEGSMMMMTQAMAEGDEEWNISIRDGLEQYVMQQVGELVFSAVENREEDLHLLKRMKLLSFLTPEALDIKPELFNEELLRLAGDELRKINAFLTPFEKVQCVIKCVTIIFRSLSLARVKQEALETVSGQRGESQLSGADDFLPLFIWVVLTSHIPALFSNCEYIQSFLNPMRLMSKPGYCLINLRSAIEFVNYIEPTSINIDPEVFQEQLRRNEEALAAGLL